MAALPPPQTPESDPPHDAGNGVVVNTPTGESAAPTVNAAPNAPPDPAKQPPPKIRVGAFEFTSVGVRLRGKPPVAEWKGPLEFALWCQKAGPWWIGDLLNAGEGNFGEMFSQMCEGLVSADMLNRYAAVAKKVPLENRLPTQSWSAHANVARLPSDLQRRFLHRAQREGWSSEELRCRVRDYCRERKPRST